MPTWRGGDAAMRDTARFHFGFSVPLRPHADAGRVVEAVAAAEGDLGIVPVAHESTSGTPWWSRLIGAEAPKIIARLPFVERSDHPAGLPVFVITRPGAAVAVHEVALFATRSRDPLPPLEPLGATLLDAAGDGTVEERLLSVPEASAQALRVHLAALDIAVTDVGGHAARFTVAPASAA